MLSLRREPSGLTISLYEYGFGYQRSDANAEGMDAFAETCVRRGKSGPRWACRPKIEKLLDVTGFRTQRLPLDRHGESQTLDAKVASKKLLGGFDKADLGGLSFWTQPNSWHHFMSDHIVTFSVIPLSAGKTLVRTKWLVHKDAKEGIDYDVKNLTAVWNATNDRDRALVEFSQRGDRSAYEPGPYSPFTEGLVEKFSAWYIGRLAENRRIVPSSVQAESDMMRDAANFEPTDSRVTRPAFWNALPERWTSDVEETLVCCHVRQETHDVKSFFFRSPQGRSFSFGRAVPHARARHRRRNDQPLLHDLVVARAAARGVDHGEARAGRQGVELAARQPAAGRRGARARPGRRIHVRTASGAQVPVPVGRLGRHAADVDEPRAP